MPACKVREEVIQMRGIKAKLSKSFDTLSNMKEFGLDEDGQPLAADKVKNVLDGAKKDVKEAMNLIAVCKMVLTERAKQLKGDEAVGCAGRPAGSSSG